MIKKYCDHYRWQLGTHMQKPIESMSKYTTETECRKAVKKTIQMLKEDDTIEVFLDDGIRDKKTKIEWDHL